MLWDLDTQIEEHTKSILENNIEEIINTDKPLAYIIGSVDFCNATIFVESPILIPRIETEYWVWNSIRKLEPALKSFRIADICCGTGCIGIAALKQLVNARCDFYDIEERACNLTDRNCAYNNVSERAIIIHKDIMHIDFDNKKYDIIFANPPYISYDDYKLLDNSVLKWEASNALTDELDGMKYINFLLEKAYKSLEKDGFMIIELDTKNAFTIFEFANTLKIYSDVVLVNDQYNTIRALYVKK
jgi:release factor glutamine methyltransferase